MKPLLVILGSGLGLLFWALIVHQPPAVEISNGTGRAIERLEVAVDGRTVAVGALGAGATDRHSLPTRREGRLTLDVAFADGHHAQFPAGWFSPGQGDPARILVVTPDSVCVNAW